MMMGPGQFHLSRAYVYGVLIPAGCAVLLTIVYGLIDNADYKSEWLTSESVIAFAIAMSIGNAVFIAVLSLTILFNRLDKVRNNFALSLVSWMALPCIWIVYLLLKDH